MTNYNKNNLAIDFYDSGATVLIYSATTFSESGANNGSISTSITITLSGDTYANDVTSKISASNIPAGLTASFVRTSSTVITATLTGNAVRHANGNDVNDLTFTFADGAFTSTATASNVENYNRSDLVIDFRGASLAVKDALPNTPSTTANVLPSLKIDSTIDILKTDKVKIVNPENNTVFGETTGAKANGNKASSSATVQSKTVLDDGAHSFDVQIFDSNGNLKDTAPITIQVVTDLDGVNPSVELAANKGDFNKDGIADWKQNNIAQLPLLSLVDFNLGASAAPNSFGAILAGNLTDTKSSSSVKLNSDAQLFDVSIESIPAALPDQFTKSSDMFNFSVMAQDGKTLTDLDPTRSGLQTRIVIDLPKGGVYANDYLKYDDSTHSWFSFLDDQNLKTYDDGATLVDTNNDGTIDRVIITITDGGRGDGDGLVNGSVSDPGMLGVDSSGSLVYSILLSNGDHYLTTDLKEAARIATGTKNIFEGVIFDSLSTASGGLRQKSYQQIYTKDWYYVADGGTFPVTCYKSVPTASGFYAASAGSNVGDDYYLFINKKGVTQFMTLTQAETAKLLTHGYTNLGVQFNTTNVHQFNFDAEGFLIANHDVSGVQDLVTSLAHSFKSTSNKGFVEAVEHYYLTDAALVGLPTGEAATVSDLNDIFGTHFKA